VVSDGGEKNIPNGGVMGLYRVGKIWYISYGDGHGRQFRESTGCMRKEEARAVLNEKQHDRRVAKHPVLRRDKNIRFDNFAQIYQKDYCQVIKSKLFYLQMLKPLKEFFGKFSLEEISLHLVQKYRNKRLSDVAVNRGHAVSQTTVNRELAVLRHAMNTAAEWGYLRFNPIDKIKMEREPKRERIFSDEEISALIAEAGLPMKYFILIAVNTGCRLSEITGLRWSEIDLKRKVITLTATRTKTQTIRHIDMNATLFELFSKLKLNREGSEYVFENPDTGKSFKWISHSWHRLLKRCKIDPPGRFHDLRHTAATRALELGASIVAVQHLLGHQNVSTTSRYSHATDKGKKEAVKLIEFEEPKAEVITLPESGQKRS